VIRLTAGVQSLPDPEISPEAEPERDGSEAAAPWEMLSVTLCIAAACQSKAGPVIVMCTDWRASSTLGSTDTSDKVRWIKKRKWVALMAGDGNSAHALVRAYRLHMANRTFTEDNAEEELKAPAHKRLADLKDSYIRSSLGISYEEFRRVGKKQFPESVVLEEYMNLRRINLGARLIIAGFVEPQGRSRTPHPLICVIEQDGTVRVEEHFAAIGEGRYVAVPPLLRRDYSRDTIVQHAIYQLYEAKTLSEIVHTVGETTSVDVFGADGKVICVSSRGYVYLDNKLAKFGPRKSVRGIRMTNRHFQNGDFEG
jgi:20S proteasome alpha/beta subunit